MKIETNLNNIEQKYIDGILHTRCGCGVCGKFFIAHRNNGVEVKFIKGHYCIGKHQSDISKEKNRLAHLGRPSPNKGKKATDETIQKIKIARSRQIMNTGWHHSEESKEKNRIAHLGKIQTSEEKIKKSIALIGISKTDEHKENISKSKEGENNPRWLGGISKFPYTKEWTRRLKTIIRKRDQCKCQLCGIQQSKLSALLDVHHIDYNKENCDPVNLISLCKSCHIKTNHERDKWIMYFNKYKEIINFEMVVNN